MRQLKINKKFTVRDTKALDKYLNEISRIPLLEVNKELELIQKMKTGDKVARERLINSNLRFVVSVSKQYQNQGLSLSDLINEGNIGLIRGIEKFDETRGFKLISYAVWWIRQSILQALADNSRMIRIPLNKVGGKSRLMRTEEKLQQELFREPTHDEIKESMEILDRDFDTLNLLYDRTISLDLPLGDNEGLNLHDIIPAQDYSSDISENLSLQTELLRVSSILTPVEKAVLFSLYGIDGQNEIELKEVGFKIGLTRERARQIKEKALRRLRNNKEVCKILKPFF